MSKPQKRFRLLSAIDPELGVVLIPLLRSWLKNGVSKANLSTSVRMSGLTRLAGGLKAPLVADVALDLHAVVKQGLEELKDHMLLMNAVNEHLGNGHHRGRHLQKAVFPEVMLVQQADGLPGPANFLMIQQALVNYDSASALLYHKGSDRVQGATTSGIDALIAIHDIRVGDIDALAKLPQQPDPFSDRVITKLSALKPRVTWLQDAWDKSSSVDGLDVRPLRELMDHLQEWQGQMSRNIDLRLIHGDPHLANLMIHSRGRGNSVRWIDPNTSLGFSDPAYDWGKLLHFAERVGWAKEFPEEVGIHVRHSRGAVVVNTSLRNIIQRREQRREALEAMIRSRALRALNTREAPEATLHLAVASAHLGLADVSSASSNQGGDLLAQRRAAFALASAITSLSKWSALVMRDGG